MKSILAIKKAEIYQYQDSEALKLQKIDFTKNSEIFCEINSLVTYFVKSLFSRNFCQKCVWKLQKFGKNFVKVLCYKKNYSRVDFT